MTNFFIDLLFPVYCLGCGRETNREFICPVCFSQIPLSKKPPLKLNSQSNLEGLIAASYYDHPLIREAVHRYKYDFVKDLAQPLTRLLIQRLNIFSDFISQKNSVLVPVPLHKKRLRWRGFNQSELLALEIGRQLNIPVVNNLIVREKHNLPQVQIQNAQQRKQNIKNAFALSIKGRAEKTDRRGLKEQHPCARLQRFERSDCGQAARLCEKGRAWSGPFKTRPFLSGKTFILIDDIATTGATLEECARALKPLQPKEIWGLVIARR